MASLSKGRKIVGNDTIESSLSPSKRSVRSTGKSKFWRRTLVRLANKESQGIKKRTDRGKLEMTNSLKKRIEVSDSVEEDENNVVILSSNNYFLLKGNKNVAFDPGVGNPYKSLAVLHYDAFPVYVGKDKCLIKIEASSVNYLDCVIRRGQWLEDTSGFRDIPGMNIVGTVKIVGPESTFQEGDRVATIVKTGGNSRYTVCSSKRLLKISASEEAHRTCAILSAYLPAFSLIQQGVGDDSKRYKDNSLFGKDIFVNGGMSNHGQAVIHLSRLLGAKTIYATGKKKDYRHLEGIGAIPLPLNGKPAMNKYFDLIIDTTSTDMLDFLRKLLAPEGRIILDHYGEISANGSHRFRSTMEFLLLYGKAFLAEDSSMCDYLHNFQIHFDIFQNDFNFLRTMSLDKGRKKIRPDVAAKLTLNEIPNAHFKLEKNIVKGVLSCDPWS